MDWTRLTVNKDILECKNIGIFVGNKAEGWISKRVFQKKQSTSNFLKKEHFLPPDTHAFVSYAHVFPPDTCVCASGGEKCLFFGKFDVLCFLWFWDLPFCIITNVLIKRNSKIIHTIWCYVQVYFVCVVNLYVHLTHVTFLCIFFFWRGQNHFLKQWRHCKVGSEYPVLGFLSLWKYFWETGPYWHIMFQNLQYTHWKLNRCF